MLFQFRMRAAALAVASCMSLAPGWVEAASLGKITVLSNLGQALRAEVEIGASREELAGMTVRLAPREAFKQAHVDYPLALQDLRFALDKRPDGTSLVRVSSTRPVNETFLDFLLELNWPAGRLVREYTFLLDPPEVAAKATGQAVSMAEAKPVEAVQGGSEAESLPAARPAQKETRPERKPETAAAGERANRKSENLPTRLVKRGDTLRQIAGETQYDGVSLEQMLLGLFRANSDAFMGNNINRMKAGAILNLPDREAVAAIPEDEAQKVYQAHAADWNAYRQKLAAAVVQGPARESGGSQSAGGRITAQVDEKASAAPTQKDQVKVSRTEAAARFSAADAAKSAADENAIAKDKALKEAQERLALLEKNVADLQKLLEMKNQNLAELQKQVAKKPEAQNVPVTAAKPLELPKAVELPKTSEPDKALEIPRSAEASPLAVAPKPVDASTSSESAKPLEIEKPAELSKAVVLPKPSEAKLPVALPEPEPEADFVDELLANPLNLAGAGGIAALLAGYALYRRRRGQSAGLSVPASGAANLEPTSVFRVAGGQSVDTGNTAPQHTDFSQTGPGTIDTDEVDPVAEADVYMAYGRDAQAEEILLEALQKDPQRAAIRIKLLEIYSARKSLQQFEKQAKELHAQTLGVGVDWEKAAAMGVRLDPANPLYAGSETLPRDATPEVKDQASAIPAPIQEPAPTAPVSAPPEEVRETPAELPPLDFDLDLEAPLASLDESQEDGREEASEKVAALDFDLDIEPPFVAETALDEMLPEAPMLSEEQVVSEEVPAVEKEIVPAAETLEPQMDELVASLETAEPFALEALEEEGLPALDFDFDLDPAYPLPDLDPEANLSTISPVEQPEPLPVEDESIESSEVEIEDKAADAPEFTSDFPDLPFAEEPVPDFNLASINLDLADESEQADTAEIPEPPIDAPSPDSTLNDAHWDEVNTKLDLAKAYEEMGDLEGARELLQEILGDGPEELVKVAEGILERINA